MKYKIARNSIQELYPNVDISNLTRSVIQDKMLFDAFRSKMNQSLNSEMSKIVGNNTKASVQDKVNELKQRIGFEGLQRKAQMLDKSEVKPFSRFGEPIQKKINDFVEGYVQRFFGSTTVPAIQEQLLNIFKKDGMKSDDVTSVFAIKFINDVIAKEKSKHAETNINYSELGKGLATTVADPANSDFFYGIMPKNKQ